MKYLIILLIVFLHSPAFGMEEEPKPYFTIAPRKSIVSAEKHWTDGAGSEIVQHAPVEFCDGCQTGIKVTAPTEPHPR